MAKRTRPAGGAPATAAQTTASAGRGGADLEGFDQLVSDAEQSYKKARASGVADWMPEEDGEYTGHLSSIDRRSAADDAGTRFMTLRVGITIDDGPYKDRECFFRGDTKKVTWKDKTTGQSQEGYPGLGRIKGLSQILSIDVLPPDSERSLADDLATIEDNVDVQTPIRFSITKNRRGYRDVRVIASLAEEADVTDAADETEYEEVTAG
jgi:hypothetical protein